MRGAGPGAMRRRWALGGVATCRTGVAANAKFAWRANESAVWRWQWLTSLRARLRRRALIMVPVRMRGAPSGASTSIRGTGAPSQVQIARFGDSSAVLTKSTKVGGDQTGSDSAAAAIGGGVAQGEAARLSSARRRATR